MTDEITPRRQALLDAARRLERTFSTTDNVPPNTGMLYLGAGFFKGDLAADAEAWTQAVAVGLRDSAPALRLLHFLRAFGASPTDNYALTCVEAAWELLRWPVKTDLPDGTLNIIRDVYARCAYYAWALGSDLGALHVAQAAAALSRKADQELFKVRYMQTCLASLRTAEDGYTVHRFDPSRERAKALNRLVDLGMLAPEVRLVTHTLLAETVLADQGTDREVLEEAKGRFAGARVADLDDREGIVRTGDFEIHEPVVEPSIVVVPSLDHLPDKKNDRGAPRSEFGHLAQRALPLVRTPDLREAAETLTTEFPWLSSVTVRILETLIGKEAALLPPVLLLGKPGCGKSEYARRLTDVLGLPRTEVSCGGMADASFGGTSRQWSTGRSCTALSAIRRAGVANPALILDELDKADPGRHNGSVLDVILSQIEPGSRKQYLDPFLECPVDLSGVAFVACCNSVEALRGPLLDRFIVLDCPDPGPEDLDAIVRGILERVRQDSGVDPRFTPDLGATEMDVLRRGWRGGSIRPLRRAVDRLLTLRSVHGLAH